MSLTSSISVSLMAPPMTKGACKAGTPQRFQRGTVTDLKDSCRQVRRWGSIGDIPDPQHTTRAGRIRPTYHRIVSLVLKHSSPTPIPLPNPAFPFSSCYNRCDISQKFETRAPNDFPILQNKSIGCSFSGKRILLNL